MTEFVHAIEAIVFFAIFIVLFQIRRQYIISLEAHRKRQSRKTSAVKVTEHQLDKGFIPSTYLPSVEVEESEQTEEELAPASTPVSPEFARHEDSDSSVENHSALGSYIDDFFSSAPYEKKQQISSDALQDIQSLEAVNDDAQTITLIGKKLS